LEGPPLRKYLIVAVAALTAMAFTAVALAQTPAATMKVTVKPKKAGTKKKPKNSSIHLFIQNNDPKRTLGKLTITSPKTFTLSAKGLTKCNEGSIETNQSVDQCPKASKVGKGVAKALVGVNSTTVPPTSLTFDVTAVVTGPKKLGFFLEGREIPIKVLSPGTIKGRKLTITVPDAAQQPATGVWAGLVSIDTTLKAKKGKHFLASTTGCKKKKHAFSTLLSFVDNGVSPAGTVTVKASSKCSK
jgi:hypothetical protein